MLMLSKIRDHWTSLRYWQKGAVLGAGLHILVVIVVMILALLGQWFNPKFGEEFDSTNRHIAEILGFLGLIVLNFVEAIPIYILRLLGSEFGPPIDVDPGTHIGAWIIYILYGTAVYSFLGACISKAVELFQGKNNGETDESGNQ